MKKSANNCDYLFQLLRENFGTILEISSPLVGGWREEVVVVNKSVLLMRSYTILVSMEDYIAKKRQNYSGVEGISNLK